MYQQSDPWPDILAAYQSGMAPFANAPINPVQMMPQPPAPQQEPNAMSGIGGILKGLGMMGLKKKPGIKGMDSPIPNFMDMFGGGMDNTA